MRPARSRTRWREIVIADPAELTADLGRSGVDTVFFAGSGDATVIGKIHGVPG